MIIFFKERFQKQDDLNY